MRYWKNGGLTLCGLGFALSACGSDPSPEDSDKTNGNANAPADGGASSSTTGGASNEPSFRKLPSLDHIATKLPSPPDEAGTACKLDSLEGAYAVKVTSDMIWSGKFYDPKGDVLDTGQQSGRANMAYYFLQQINDDGKGGLKGTQQLCWFVQPDIAHLAIVAEETWGIDPSPTDFAKTKAFDISGSYNCTYEGCTVLLNPVSLIYGLNLKPSDEWPKLVGETDPKTWQDADGDGHVGISYAPKADGDSELFGSPYMAFPLTPMKTTTWARSDELYMAMRVDMHSSELALGKDCTGSAGETQVTFDRDILLGCHWIEGTGEPGSLAPKGGEDCTDSQVDYLDRTRPSRVHLYKGEELQSIYRGVLKADGADTSDGKGGTIERVALGAGPHACADVLKQFSVVP